MSTNAFAISRSFVEAGIEKKAADAIAEAMVTHSNETFATKADVANFATKTDIAELKVELIKWMIGINFTTIAIVVTLIKLL